MTSTNPCSDRSELVRLIACPQSHTRKHREARLTCTRSTSYMRRGELNKKTLSEGGLNEL